MSRRTGTRVVCYCGDCQAFARFLERTDVLDAAGGTDIYQMAQGRVEITEGASLLRVMRLSPKGLLRWYTECCRTPVGNTVHARLPFVGLILTFMDTAAMERGGPGEADLAAGERARDAVLGPPRARIHGADAIGGCPAGVHPRVSPTLIARLFPLLATWWLTGKGTPSPFFDTRPGANGAPRAEPRVLTPAERDALRRPPARQGAVSPSADA